VKKYGISFIGAGKVAGSLSRKLSETGFTVKTIFSRNSVTGRKLAERTGASWSPEPVFSDQSDVIIAAVPDDSLRQILSRIKCKDNAIVAHTAGSLGLDVFPAGLKHKGVFYPLQTFSEGRKIDFKGLPVFIESSDNETMEILKEIAGSIGATVYVIDEDHRRLLHVAAVFVNNFTNFMFTAGKRIAEKAGMNFEILEPLIRETVSKAFDAGPEKSQTGPALRLDKGTIEKHINLLSFSSDLQKTYSEMTESIISYYKNIKDDQF
jgi:predicted short-subunit dehydrogenase-like oxidoreductase (DUF2520 family)